MDTIIKFSGCGHSNVFDGESIYVRRQRRHAAAGDACAVCRENADPMFLERWVALQYAYVLDDHFPQIQFTPERQGNEWVLLLQSAPAPDFMLIADRMLSREIAAGLPKRTIVYGAERFLPR
jgi:hypothetical protein